MKILIPLGTRPEIVKLAPVIVMLTARGHEVTTLATGQHYDANLTDTFFDELGVRPDIRWELPADESERVGAILTRAMDVIRVERPDLVLVLGDTYTVPLFCLAARRFQTPVAHLEAGLRSFNETSIEESNRKIAAVTARLHFAPTTLAAQFLAKEGVARERIRVVGNPVIDVLVGKGLQRRDVSQRRGVLFTAHRPTNVDDPARLRDLVEIIRRLGEEVGTVVFPVHPRTKSRLVSADLWTDLAATNVRLLEPLPYEAMLEELATCRLVVTDSGGLQEEAAFFGVPAIVLRRSTPRWEGISEGLSALSGVNVERVMELATYFSSPEILTRIVEAPCPYGDGDTAERVADALEDPNVLSLLPIVEPDLTEWRPT